MNLDEVAEKLGYIDAEHLETNIYNYGEPLPQWWDVIKELVNKLPLNDVSVSLPDNVTELLKDAKTLVGHPLTNISGSTDVACMEWQDKYENWLNER